MQPRIPAPAGRAERGHRRATPACAPLAALLWALGAAACGNGGSGSFGTPASVGAELTKPGESTTFFVDPHQQGRATSLRILELSWGRLVDVHDVDGNRQVNASPVFRDYVVHETIQTDATRYRLDRNPITEKTRLIIDRTRGEPDDGSGTFATLLAEAGTALPGLLTKTNDGTALPPFSMLPRNACVVVRFNDLLRDDDVALRELAGAVLVTIGYPAVIPFTPRLIFDSNHGGVAGGRFHSTRLLIDMTTSESEAANMATPQPINTLGLPHSLDLPDVPNVILSFPTKRDFGSGQFALLEGLSGVPLDASTNGPIDATLPTVPVIRALRSGNDMVVNNGFLLDFDAPRVLGNWPITVIDVVDDPLGRPGFDFLAGLLFASSCRAAPERGNVIVVGSTIIEVSEKGAGPDASGLVRDVRVRSLNETPITNPGALVGQAGLRSVYDPGKLVPSGCWVTISPHPGVPPSGRVSPLAQVTVRFTDPMDPLSFKPYDSFLVIGGPKGTSINSRSLVVGTIASSLDLREFTFTPSLPFAHEGLGETYTLQVVSIDRLRERGVTDLGGNTLADPLPAIEFNIDPDAEPLRNGSLVLRYNFPDEIGTIFAPDHRGNVFLDLNRGVLVPREVVYFSVPVDSTVPVPSIMIPFPPGVQTPLSPLGSKMQALWRYVDVGWQIRDETKYDMDVIGASWSPVGGQVNRDFFDQFEMRLSHARKIPDEQKRNFGTAKYGRSGLGTGQIPFASNVLDDARSRQKIVHNKSLGYRIDPADLFLGNTGTPLIPWPMNRGAKSKVTYTWRDTSVLARGGNLGAGVPLDIEVGQPLNLESKKGSFAAKGKVPSVGLPLLMEFRCYPSNSGIGLNALAISLAINTSVRPNFRTFSTGGTNRAGRLVRKNPDFQVFPTGGFNPGSIPPGRRTRFVADNTLYHGQLDVVVRVSRGHSIWMDSESINPTYFTPVVDPELGLQPTGTKIILEYRGAHDFSNFLGNNPFDARDLDTYGNLNAETVTFNKGRQTWTDDIRDLDGARYFQVRYTFFSDIQTGVRAEISSLAFPYSGP